MGAIWAALLVLARLCSARPPRPSGIVAAAAVATAIHQRLDLARLDADIVQGAAIERAQQKNRHPPGAPVPVGVPGLADQGAGAGGNSRDTCGVASLRGWPR